MISTGIFTKARFHIHAPIGQKITLAIIGDVHRDAPLFDKEKWDQTLEDLKRDRAYILGMGDYCDMLSSSERMLVDGKVHDSTTWNLDELAARKSEILARELAFAKGRILGLVGGGHFHRYQDGTTSDNHLCRLLGCQYLGVSCFLRLTIGPGKSSKGGGTAAVDIWAHHGKGASDLVGSSFNTVEKMMLAAVADIYIMNHDHSIGALPVSRFEFSKRAPLDIIEKRIYVVRGGHFLRSYVDGEASYVVDRAKRSKARGAVKLGITYRRPMVAGRRRTIVDIEGTA